MARQALSNQFLRSPTGSQLPFVAVTAANGASVDLFSMLLVARNTTGSAITLTFSVTVGATVVVDTTVSVPPNDTTYYGNLGAWGTLLIDTNATVDLAVL
jgi:hypothetical protein